MLVAGTGLLFADAQARYDAAQRSVSFTAEESELLGPDADRIRDSLRSWSLFESLVMSSDVSSFSVEIQEGAGGTREVSVLQEAQSVLVPVRGSWHVPPVTLPAFAGLAVAVGGLFLGAMRWRRRRV
jgi:hypothetical protein